MCAINAKFAVVLIRITENQALWYIIVRLFFSY